MNNNLVGPGARTSIDIDFWSIVDIKNILCENARTILEKESES